MIKKILTVLILMFCLSAQAYSQSIEAGDGSYRTILKNDKFLTKTKIEHIVNNSDRDINLSVITYFVKRQYTGGTYYYNKILASKNIGTIYAGEIKFNIKFNNAIKPFSQKGYVYTLIYDQDTGTPYWFYNYEKKTDFGNLVRISPENIDRSILIASGKSK